MKNFPVFAFFLLFIANLKAQDTYHSGLQGQLQSGFGLPGGSQWFLPNTETATFSGSASYGATVTTIVPAGQPFAQARRFMVPQGANPWDAGHLYHNTAAIASGDKCLVVIWLRSPTPDARVSIFAENSSTYAKEIYAPVLLTGDWQQFIIPFKSSAAYAVNTLSIGLHLAWKSQTVEVGGAACLNFKNLVTFEQLPIVLNNDHYAGQEPDAPWRAEAAMRIDQLRKANLTVHVTDPNGNPLPNALVHVDMLQHEFKFGSAVISNRFGGGNNQDDAYEQHMVNLDGNGHGFNEVVFENDLKWPAWEQHWYSSWPEIASAVQWLHDQDITIRGHNLVWPGWTYSPPDLQPNQNNPNYLKTRIHNHLNHILSYPGVGAECEDWDVLNEITANTDYANALAGTPGYTTGRELYAEIFRQADSLVPNAKLYLNDYVAIERGDIDNGSMNTWKTRLDELVAAGAPVEGIGFQGHFGAFPTGIPRVNEILDDFWNTYGLEAKITEYDIDKLVPPQTQADYMRDILTICFAHPSMKGFLMWGFWDGAHWEDNAPLFRDDWSLKPGGEAFIDQVFNQWRTDETVPVAADGTASVRGFRGKYRVEVMCGNSIQEQYVTLDGDKTLDFTLACVVRTRETDADWGLAVAPTLARDELRVQWNQSAQLPAQLTLSNLGGTVLASATLAPPISHFVFQLDQFPSGGYFVQVTIGGKSQTQKFFIQR